MEARTTLNPLLHESKVFRTDGELAVLFSRQRPAAIWDSILTKYQQALVTDRARLLAEGQAAGVFDQEREEPDDLLVDLRKLDPKRGLQLLHHQSPDLDLSQLADAEPYQVAVAVLRIYSPAEA
jgi:hypothetical protein